MMEHFADHFQLFLSLFRSELETKPSRGFILAGVRNGKRSLPGEVSMVHSSKVFLDNAWANFEHSGPDSVSWGVKE